MVYFAQNSPKPCMSSHHIVRDFQEPALIVADGESCSLTLLHQLLEWSPVVVVLDEAFLKVASLGIKVDYWLGDFDKIDPAAHLQEVQQDHVEIVETPDQNKTDLEKAIDFLEKKGSTEINILWADGRRVDHALANFSTLAKYEHLKLVMWNDWSKAYIIPHRFEKWLEKDAIVSLIPMPEAQDVVTEGLFYPLSGEALVFGQRVGSSNHVAEDGMVRITYSSGKLLLIEAWD